MRLLFEAPRLEREMAWEREPFKIISDVLSSLQSGAPSYLGFVMCGRRMIVVDILVLHRDAFEALLECLNVRHDD